MTLSWSSVVHSATFWQSLMQKKPNHSDRFGAADNDALVNNNGKTNKTIQTRPNKSNILRISSE